MPSLPSRHGRPRVQLPALPDAENEARQIAKLFSARPLIGSDATKEHVMALMPSARILHFATHGLLDRDSGEYFNALALAPSGTDSGFLQAREINKMELEADLVVLSACDTAEGKLTGDGVLGLSSAFAAAGVPSAVVALWAIPDAPTAQLMTEFYRALRQSGNQAQALRQAMLRTMKNHPDPGDWAAFELIGESASSESLRTAKGDSSLAAPGSGNTVTTFVVPEAIWDYRESVSTDFPASPSVSFTSDQSITALMKFYRDTYRGKGLKEDEALTFIEEKTGQLVFGGPWQDRELVIQITDALGSSRVVSMRFEKHRP
jgi:hypothetical protein